MKKTDKTELKSSAVSKSPKKVKPKKVKKSLLKANAQVKKQIEATDLKRQIMMPRRTVDSLMTLEGVKEAFSLPITMGTTQDNREKLNMAFDSMGGYAQILGSLQQHAYDMGEFPITSFLGYGTLQQIAQNGMIRTCIQTVADDVTREWIEIEGGDESDSDKVDELQDLQDNKYHLRKLFNEAVAKVGYMGGAFIYIETGEQNPELPLIISEISSELEKGSTVRFVVVDPVSVTPGEYNSIDPLRPDFMKPKWWWVLGKRVHRSRLIALVDNPPPDLLKPAYNFLGIPQAQILWDYVIHWNQCRTYTADLLRKVSLLVMKTNVDNIFASANGIQDFDIRMQALQRFRDNDSVFVCDKDNEDVENVQLSLGGCTEIVKQSLEFVVAMNRTPAVKLLGISPSGFSTGDTDLRNYNDHILSKQELRRDAIMTCLKVIQLVEFGTIDDSINFKFKELGTNDEFNQSMAAKTRMEVVMSLNDRQAISPEELRQVAKKEDALGLGFIADDMPEMDPQDPQLGGFGEGEDTSNPFEKFMQGLKGNKAQEPKNGNQPDMNDGIDETENGQSGQL